MKTYKFLAVLLIGFSVVSCSDLEEEPVGLLSPDGFFQSTKDVQTAVNAVYGHFIHEHFWGRKLSIALLLRGDMSDLASDQTRRVEQNMLTTLADNGMTEVSFPRTYMAIAAANNAIAGAEVVGGDELIMNPIVAQAYFLRAFSYFHLVRQYGAIPYIDAPITDLSAASSISSTPAADVYENIIADLEFAKMWLPETVTSRAIPSKAAASSYLALVYLTRAGTNGTADFQLAFDEAKEVIDNAGTYDLALEDDFQDLFDANVIDGSKEPIFSLDYNNLEADGNYYDQVAPMTGIRGHQINDGGGWSVCVPALSVYTTWDANDYRRAVSLDDGAVIDPAGDDTDPILVDYTQYDISGHQHAKNQPYIAKYTRYPGPFDRGSGRATSHNYNMMRFAEVYLIAAEAAVEIGNNAAALSYLNEVRARARQGGVTIKDGVVTTVAASASPADHVGTVTVDDVLEERRLELAFEMKRWYDIARRRLGSTVFSASGLEGAKPGFTDDDYLLPIPAAEMQANPNLSQNAISD